MTLFDRIASRLIEIGRRRPPDFIVGGVDNAYLCRWWLIPRNPIFKIYLHQFLRDDDDRALHDHPWPWCSVLLHGAYLEHTIAAGGIHRRVVRRSGSIRFASPWRAHRIELPIDSEGCSVPCWTLFVTGPRLRNWGFHCPERGWVPWWKFVDATDIGKVGPGCGEQE